MIKDIINNIFNNVSYWGEKDQLLRAIPAEYYHNKSVLVRLLGVTKESLGSDNEAKRDMWNHHINQSYMGDDILQNASQDILDDMEFAKQAVIKYNRAYAFLSKRLQASYELAKLAAMHERSLIEGKNNLPILYYMPENFKSDHEVSTMATTRNIENLEYATNLKRNKYFIFDMMNLLDDSSIKEKILRCVDKSLLSDKKFVARLGCYDNLCQQFTGDVEYVAHAAQHDISILRKTDLFDEMIIKYALKNNQANYSRGYILAEIFRYIERFNHNYYELSDNIRNQKTLNSFFWEMGEMLSEEFI